MTDEQISVVVGGNVRARRIALKLSQESVGEALGISFQQVQKYETGKNRISTPTLVRLAVILRTTVSALLGETELLETARA